MDFLKEWVGWIFGWVRDTCDAILGGLIDLIFAAFPVFDTPDLTYILPWYETINSWVPISEFIILWGGHLAFMSVLISVRWFIKMTPFIGG